MLEIRRGDKAPGASISFMDLQVMSNAGTASNLGERAGSDLACKRQCCPSVAGLLTMLLRRALPVARQILSHSFPIYEMGSHHAHF